MNYGFAIDNRSCIGCHACSTACKSENSVPLGVSRTWVKYTETGTYPDARRGFQVSRCNHCANPPCVRICPVTAMYQRDDGIVEFDAATCIGCKGCMQACPYDAIHIDPSSGTAAKCHFCSHRIEVGLEPACVVVCPTHSIIAGDLDDPKSEISRVIAKNNVTVRKPEQGTAPNLFYIDGHDVSLHPTALPREPAGMMFAEVLPIHDDGGLRPVVLDMGDGPMLKPKPQPQGLPDGGPIQVGQRSQAGQMVSVAYNAQHKVPWHWQVPAYLVTKAVGSGVIGLLALAVVAGWSLAGTSLSAGLFLGLAMLGLTTVFLVMDLERPERFLSILYRPQWRSWIARGAFILIGLSTVAGGWWALELLGVIAARTALAWVTLPLAVMGAIYTAFLFAQAEGRDLWQSPLLPVHMAIQAVLAGAAGLLLLGAVGGVGPELLATARLIGAGALLADLFVLGVGEFGIPHASEIAARAAHDITHGRYARTFWIGAILTGHLVPLILLGLGVLAPVAAVLMIGGLYAYEHCFVMAPQDIPNS